MADRRRQGVRGSRGGFTLLEILVALAITGIALAVVYQLFSGNLKNVAVSEDYVAATAVGEASMRSLLSGETLGEETRTETTPEGYIVEILSTEALKERTENLQVTAFDIALTVKWTRGGRQRAVRLRTLQLVPKGSAFPATSRGAS